MIPRSLSSARRLPAERRRGSPVRHSVVEYLSAYCAACGRVGFASRCSTCAEVLCVDRGSCHPRHQPLEYVAQRPIDAKRPVR